MEAFYARLATLRFLHPVIIDPPGRTYGYYNWIKFELID